ncbi:hypothetical protein ACTXT7_017365, partial [Hymenolepis weldensis]
MTQVRLKRRRWARQLAGRVVETVASATLVMVGARVRGTHVYPSCLASNGSGSVRR